MMGIRSGSMTDISAASAHRFSDRFVREKCISLTTFRRDGRPVATPVWFVIDGDHLVVWTSATTAKVKRLRHTSRVTFAPCTVSGKLKGAPLEGTARILPEQEGPRIQSMLSRRYGMSWRLLAAVNATLRAVKRKQPSPRVHIEISAAQDPVK